MEPTDTLQLPHTHGCLVCGRDNPHGLKLDLCVDPQSGLVTAELVPQSHHIGFEGIIHGGLLATVLDEAMVWAATWACRCFCVCAEMTVRFRQSANVGDKLIVEAKVESSRKIITTTGVIRRGEVTIAEASGKYMLLPPKQNDEMMNTFVSAQTTQEAARYLRG